MGSRYGSEGDLEFLLAVWDKQGIHLRYPACGSGNRIHGLGLSGSRSGTFERVGEDDLCFVVVDNGEKFPERNEIVHNRGVLLHLDDGPIYWRAMET